MQGKVWCDRYQMQQQLGKNGGRQTLLALDLQTNEPVVVKLLSFDPDLEWDDLKLFEREVETLKSLSHPNIPRYLDCFEIDSPDEKQIVLVQSYVKGRSLEACLTAGRRFSPAEIRQLARSLLNILRYLHGRQPPVIHRDIKPSNILLSDCDDDILSQVYLVDFGSVQTLAAQQGRTITVVGTYGYMPPEQFGGRAVPASDLYSVGATLIALATGQHPADLPQRDLQLQFEAAASLPPNLTHWLQQMTYPSLEKRFTSVQSALESLEPPLTRNFPPPLPRKKLSNHQLLASIIARSIIMGIFTCGTFYAILGILLFPHHHEQILGVIWGAIGGAIGGGGIGFILGTLNGLLLALITRSRFHPLLDFRQYRRVIQWVSSLFAAAGNSTIVFCLAILFGAYGGWSLYLFIMALSAIVAGLAGRIVGRDIVRWYEQATRPEEQ